MGPEVKAPPVEGEAGDGRPRHLHSIHGKWIARHLGSRQSYTETHSEVGRSRTTYGRGQRRKESSAISSNIIFGSVSGYIRMSQMNVGLERCR